jgi:hypothetical protein
MQANAKSKVNFATRMNTGATTEPPLFAAAIQLPSRCPAKIDLGLNRSFSVFVNPLATNPT